MRGSNLYYVRLTIKNDLVTQLSCTCPYYSNCKHEAALLYYLEDHKEILEQEDHSHTYMGGRHYKEKLENIFKKAQGRGYSMHGYYDLDYIANPLLRFMDEDIPQLIIRGEYNLCYKLLNSIMKKLDDDMYMNYDEYFDIARDYVRYAATILESDELDDTQRTYMEEKIKQLSNYV